MNLKEEKQFFKNKIGKQRRNCNEYDFSLKNEQIIGSWTFEYSLFELIRLYKTIDWDKYYVVYLAY